MTNVSVLQINAKKILHFLMQILRGFVLKINWVMKIIVLT